MTGYASNPTPIGESVVPINGASFLARKGEALPAVDAQAHAGVDVESYQQHPSGYGIKSGHRRKARANREFATLYRQPRRPNSSGTTTDQTATDIANDDEGTAPPTAREAWFANRKQRRVRFDRETMRAVVTFKMPITDFVRLRRASSKLQMTCQAILLDAVDCYLEANEVEALTLEEAKREAAQYSKRRAKAHAAKS